MSQTYIGYLDTDLGRLLVREVLSEELGFENERETLGYDFNGCALVEPVSQVLQGGVDTRLGTLQEEDTRVQKLDELTIIKSHWRFLDETEQQKRERQPAAPKPFYVGDEYALLDMIFDYLGLIKALPVVAEHAAEQNSEFSEELLRKVEFAKQSSLLTPHIIQHLAKIRKALLGVCRNPQAVLQDSRLLGLRISQFWYQVEGELTDDEDLSSRPPPPPRRPRGRPPTGTRGRTRGSTRGRTGGRTRGTTGTVKKETSHEGRTRGRTGGRATGTVKKETSPEGSTQSSTQDAGTNQ